MIRGALAGLYRRIIATIAGLLLIQLGVVWAIVASYASRADG